MATRTKKSTDVLMYMVDWASETTDRSETISTSTFTVPTGITIDSQSNTDTTASVWLSGGRHGVDYIINSRVVMSDGHEISKQFDICVDDFVVC